MAINRYFKLFLNAGAASPLVINVNQYDKDELWHFTLLSETGEQYYPNAAAIVGKKNDGNLIANAATVDGRGYVNVTETEQMTAAPGVNYFELLIDGQIHGTANFIVLVEPSPTEGGVVSDSDLSLIQQAMDSISPAVIAQKVADWMDENLTPTTPPVDASLKVQGAAADAKKTGDEISDLKSQISSSQGMSAEFKSALENLLSKVAYIDANGQTYFDALHTAMYPPANLTRITAVYTQGSTVVYDTDTLDSLKANLVVTAYYDNGTSEVVSSYVLSGTLTEGTSTITATYGGKSATFNVTVTEDTEYGTFTPTNVITGSYINTDGSIGTYETSAYSETYYPVKHNVISFGGTGWENARAFNVRLCLYNSEKTFLRQLRIRKSSGDSADYHGNPVVIAIPNDAKYFRLSWADDSAPLPNPEFTINNLTYTDLFMEIGDIDSSTGADKTSTTRIRSTDYISVNGSVSVSGCPFAETWYDYGHSASATTSGYAFRCYDSSKNIVGSLTDGGQLFNADISNVALPANTAYVRVFIQQGSTTYNVGFSTAVINPFAIDGNYYLLTEE